MPINQDEIIIEKFNQLSEIDYSDVIGIDRISNQAFEMINLNSNNLQSKLLFLQTKLMLGKAKEAMVMANDIWASGGNIDDLSRSIFIGQLVDLGLFEWAKVLIDTIIKADDFNFRLFYPSILAYSIGIGDFETLELLANHPENNEHSEILSEFIEMQKTENLDVLFTKQQKMLNDILKGKQTSYEILLTNERGFAEIEVGVFVGGESIDRQILQDKINKDVDVFYHKNSKVPLNNFITSIFDIKSHWAG